MYKRQLINQTEDQARALLSTRKLVMTVVNVTNATVAKGLIVDQDPDSDTMVNVGTSVQVMVSVSYTHLDVYKRQG